MSEPKTKMTLLLTPAERARLDALRLARGDRHASATLRALVRDAGVNPPRDPAAPPGHRGWCVETAAEKGAEDGEALARDTVQREGREALERALWGIMPAWGRKARDGAERRAVPLHLQAAYMRAHTEAARRVLNDPRAPAPPCSENTIGLVNLAPGAVLPPTFARRAPEPPRATAAGLREPDTALLAACRRPGFVPDVLRRALIALGWSFADDGTGAIVWYPPACDPETAGQDGILAALAERV